MKANRPVNFAVMQNLPFTAVASITHRITGGVLFVGVGFLLYLLQLAMKSEDGFAEANRMLAQTSWKLCLLAVLAVLIYHFFAGIKHLLLDMHVGDTYPAARAGAYTVTALSVVAVIMAGVWIW